ncbi:MAG: porin family protein [Rikenellaceae bacterium]
MRIYISVALTLCAVLFTNFASAQMQEQGLQTFSDDNKKITWGLKAGVNLASTSLHGNDTEGREEYRVPLLGFSGGVTAEYKFNKDISLSSEILFSQQGVKYKYPTVYGNSYDDDEDEYTDGSDCKVTHRFSYINIPILFNYYFVKDKNISFNIGIQVGFLVGESSSTKFSYYMDGSSARYDGAYGWDLEPNPDGSGTYTRNDAGYYIFDMGVPFGFTWGFKDNLTLDARYTLGVLDTFKQTTDYDYDKNFGSTNNTFTISLGYKF